MHGGRPGKRGRKVIRQIVVSDLKIIWNFPRLNGSGSDFFNRFVIACAAPPLHREKLLMTESDEDISRNRRPKRCCFTASSFSKPLR